MSIFTRTRPKVKPTRTKPVDRHRFGQGLTPTYPTFAAPASLSDMAWWAAREGRIEAANARLEARAVEAEQERLVEAGVGY